MSDKDQIKELFSQKLGGYEAKVNPELWTNIATQVGAATTTTAAATGMSLLTKTIIGLSAAGVIATGVIVYTLSGEETPQKQDVPTKEPIKTAENTQETAPKVPSNTVVAEPTNAQEQFDQNQASVVRQSEPESQDRNSLVGPIDPLYPGVIDGYIVPNGTNPERGDNPTDPNETQKDPVIKSPINPPIEGVIDDPDPQDHLEMPVDEGTDHLHQEDDPTNTTAQPAQELEPLEFELPSIFTPNRDNRNDFFFFEEIPDNLTSFSFIVKDQNGETVYVSDNPNFKWDGRNMYTGELVKKGIHAYVVIAEDDLGRTFKSSQYLMIEY